MRRSVLLNHDLRSLDDGCHGIALLELEFVGTASADQAFDQIVTDSHDHMGHHVTQLDFLDFPAQFVASRYRHVDHYKTAGSLVMNLRRFIGTAILGLAFLCRVSEAQQITLAVAADLQFAMEDIAARFQRETRKIVKIIYGSSGTFFQQIPSDAPFDMFFSANLEYRKKLQAAGLILSG